MEGLWKTLFNWMIWGYHYFRKHPYLHFEVYIFSNATYRRSGWMMRSDGLLIQSLNPLKTGSPSRNIARCFIFPNSLQVFFLFQISGWWIWILTYILSHWFEYIYICPIGLNTIWYTIFIWSNLFFSQIFWTVLRILRRPGEYRRWGSVSVWTPRAHFGGSALKVTNTDPHHEWLEDGDWMSRLYTYISLNHYRSRMCLLKTCFQSSNKQI